MVKLNLLSSPQSKLAFSVWVVGREDKLKFEVQEPVGAQLCKMKTLRLIVQKSGEMSHQKFKTHVRKW